MKKLCSLVLLLATASVSAHTDLTIQIIKDEEVIARNEVRFTENGQQHEVDGLMYEVATEPDGQGNVTLDLKIYGRNELGDVVPVCQGAGKIAINEETTVDIAFYNQDNEVVQTMKLTFLITE